MSQKASLYVGGPARSTSNVSSSPILSRHKPSTDEEVQYHLKFIDPLFQTASHIVQTRLPASGPIQPTYKEKLLLYSFFKQAVHGDVQGVSARPGVFDMLGRAKWDAWKKLEGLQPADAKKLYVDTLLKILKKHSETPEAMILIEGLEGFTPSVAKSDLSSGNTEHSPPRLGSHLAEDREDIEEEVSDLSDPDERSSLQSHDPQPPSSLGPYVTRAQLPDPVNVSQRGANGRPLTIDGATFAKLSRTMDEYKPRPTQRFSSHARTEASAASQQHTLNSDGGPSNATRRLSKLQLATLISKPIRVDDTSSQISWDRRRMSCVTNDAMVSAVEGMPERSDVTPDAYSPSQSSILAPLPPPASYRERARSRSQSRRRREDLTQKVEVLHTTVLALQARLDKLEQAQDPPPIDSGPPPFRWQDLLFCPRNRAIVVKQWLKLAGGPFLSTLSHLLFICALIWSTRVIGTFGRAGLRAIWQPRVKYFGKRLK